MVVFKIWCLDFGVDIYWMRGCMKCREWRLILYVIGNCFVLVVLFYWDNFG